MSKRFTLIFFFCLIISSMVAEASYFLTYEFTPDNCEYLDAEKIKCTFSLVSNESNLYFIETDELLTDRVRDKSTIVEIGANIWPSKPTYGVYVFVGFLIFIAYLLYKRR